MLQSIRTLTPILYYKPLQSVPRRDHGNALGLLLAAPDSARSSTLGCSPEFGDDPDRYAGARARKNYAGSSPITRASGKKKAVLARFVRNHRLADALYQQAFCALNVADHERGIRTVDVPDGRDTAG